MPYYIGDLKRHPNLENSPCREKPQRCSAAGKLIVTLEAPSYRLKPMKARGSPTRINERLTKRAPTHVSHDGGFKEPFMSRKEIRVVPTSAKNMDGAGTLTDSDSFPGLNPKF